MAQGKQTQLFCKAISQYELNLKLPQLNPSKQITEEVQMNKTVHYNAAYNHRVEITNIC